MLPDHTSRHNSDMRCKRLLHLSLKQKLVLFGSAVVLHCGIHLDKIPVKVLLTFHIFMCCVYVRSVPLQEMPSYNEKRRCQALLVMPQPSSLLQRSRSNPQMYYRRVNMLNGMNGSLPKLSSTSFPQRRCDTCPRNVYSASYQLFGSEAGRPRYDVDSLRSMSVSSASSLSGRRLSMPLQCRTSRRRRYVLSLSLRSFFRLFLCSSVTKLVNTIWIKWFCCLFVQVVHGGRDMILSSLGVRS